jgi:lysyl-tRNA synthetase, class II
VSSGPTVALVGWKWLTSPQWLARLVALLGVVSVVSALVPAWRGRLDLLGEVLPAVAPAAATAGAAAVGVLLVVLARGLRRGKRRAWWLTSVLAAVVSVLHVVKGLDVEEAALAAAVFALLLAGRRNFIAASAPRSARRTAGVAVAMVVAMTVLGWTLLTGVDGGQQPGTTSHARLLQAFLGLGGMSGPVRFTTSAAADQAATTLLVLGGIAGLAVLSTALRPPGGPHALSVEDEDHVRALLDRYGDVDSLSYFALRRDRSVVFSPTGKAAVSYRVVGGVSLAAGDPVGDPEAWPGAVRAWSAEARRFGWIPAVLGASERAAVTYAREGFDALELGDEAVVEVADFRLDGRAMRGVRQAVARVQRAGYRVRCDRTADVSPVEVERLRAAVDAWRDGPVERGYSMALGRVGDPGDGRCVIVRAVDETGTLAGMLHLVPWGTRGLSLDLMRRARDAENGMIEAMVTGLLADCSRLGVDHVSLNFAVFRAVFARGDRPGAGPVLRLWRAILLQASRFWQIESLYRSNAKYRPEWVPRFLCFDRPGHLTAVGLASLRAEAFLVAPDWLRRLARSGLPDGGRAADHERPVPGLDLTTGTPEAAATCSTRGDEDRAPARTLRGRQRPSRLPSHRRQDADGHPAGDCPGTLR